MVSDTGATERIIHVDFAPGNMGNKMLQYMAAIALSRLIGDCKLSGVRIPEWEINLPDIRQENPRVLRITSHVTTKLNLREIAQQVLSGSINRVELNIYSSHIDNLLPREEYAGYFRKSGSVEGFEADTLLINIRGNEVLRAVHKHYTVLPIEFYIDLVAETRLTPVFMGQLDGGSKYVDRLRRAFPHARFLSSRGAVNDFDTIRNSKNIVTSISTFSWLAAWLSDADRIFMPLSGFCNPLQYPAVNLAPKDDARFSYYLFPVNYAVTDEEIEEAHKPLIGKWRPIAYDDLQTLLGAKDGEAPSRAKANDRSSYGLGLCYVIIIFDQLAELIYCLWSIWEPRNTYILMVDIKSCSACRSLCEMLGRRFENIHCIPGHNGSWGGASLISAALSGIRAGLANGRAWQHLFLISGNHVALQDQQRIGAGLAIGKSYLRATWIPNIGRPSPAEFPACADIQRRLWGWWEEIPGVKSVLTGIRPELPEVRFFKGSQWIALSRPACEALSGPDAAPLTSFFAHSFVPDETFFHTAVRCLELPENIVSLDTTYHGWEGGHATLLTEDDYKTAALIGRWFARKAPRSITPSFAEAIRSYSGAMPLDEFVRLIEPSELENRMIHFTDDGVKVAKAEGDDNNETELLQSRYERLARALTKAAGPDAAVGEYGGDIFDIRIEPSGIPPLCSPVVGVVRSTDGKTAWATIQLRAALFTETVASLLLAGDGGGSEIDTMMDNKFEETHMEPHFREFFRPEFRTAYVFEVEQIDSVESQIRLASFFKLLAEGWSRLRYGVKHLSAFPLCTQ
jgi:hypothetical protein